MLPTTFNELKKIVKPLVLTETDKIIFEVRIREGSTSLHWAAAYKPEVLESILTPLSPHERAEELKKPDSKGLTVWHIAALHSPCVFKTIEKLLTKEDFLTGLQLKATQNGNDTPLHMAAATYWSIDSFCHRPDHPTEALETLLASTVVDKNLLSLLQIVNESRRNVLQTAMCDFDTIKLKLLLAPLSADERYQLVMGDRRSDIADFKFTTYIVCKPDRLKMILELFPEDKLVTTVFPYLEDAKRHYPESFEIMLRSIFKEDYDRLSVAYNTIVSAVESQEETTCFEYLSKLKRIIIATDYPQAQTHSFLGFTWRRPAPNIIPEADKFKPQELSLIARIVLLQKGYWGMMFSSEESSSYDAQNMH